VHKYDCDDNEIPEHDDEEEEEVRVAGVGGGGGGEGVLSEESGRQSRRRTRPLPAYLHGADLEKAFNAAAAAASGEVQSWREVEGNIHGVLRSLFSDVMAKEISGHWPGSRAIYGVDVIVDQSGQAYVLEVNFSPDLSNPMAFTQGRFLADAFATLFTEERHASFVPL
jgi:hypothetical protein